MSSETHMTDIDDVNTERSLLAAWVLDGRGGGTALDWRGIESWTPEQGTLWVHLDRNVPAAREWLMTQGGIDLFHAEALFEDETRPRYSVEGGDAVLLLTLRTPNLKPPSLNPEEAAGGMLSVRLWSDGARIFTTRRLPIRALRVIDERLRAGHGPLDASDFVEALCKYVTQTITTVLSDLEEELEGVERALLSPGARVHETQDRLSLLQRAAINLRRYIAFQPGILGEFENEPAAFMKDKDLRQIRDTAARMTYAQSWIDSMYDRNFNCQQQIYMRATIRTGRTTYLLTAVASVFLPLTFLTGLLGANIGGIPGADHPFAFWILVGGSFGVALSQLLLLRLLRWF